LILESCNQEKENNVLPTTKTLGKNDSIIYDTEGNIQSVIKLFGKLKRKVTFYGKGEVDFLISEDDKKNEILFFNNSQLYKIEKKKIYDESHDQFLYFDTTNHSVSIDGNRSHGVITYFELDTVRQGESQRLKILSIGNRKMAGKHINDVVKYDVAFNASNKPFYCCLLLRVTLGGVSKDHLLKKSKLLTCIANGANCGSMGAC
jgi:hypothetical protein